MACHCIDEREVHTGKHPLKNENGEKQGKCTVIFPLFVFIILQGKELLEGVFSELIYVSSTTVGDLQL